MIAPWPVFPFLEYQTCDTAIKRSRSYFDQVQGQIFVTNKSMWDFAVSTHVDLKVVRVDFDSEYSEKSINSNLNLFYDQ